MEMRVNNRELNLRTEPLVKPSTLIVSLPFGQKVDVVGNSERDGWKKVKVNYNGNSHEGHISASFLRKPSSDSVEKAVSAAAVEWDRFKRGAGKETAVPFASFVGEMWQSIGLNFTGLDTSQPWSAAYISFVLRKASYANFKFASAHAKYINEAIVARENNDGSKDFWGFRINEHKPQIGDLVARRRTSSSITYEFALDHDAFKSHTDLVIAVGDMHVDTVGGNVSNSVSITRYSTSASGFLESNGGRVFAVLRNNH